MLELGEINPFGGTDETAQPLKICGELHGEAIPPLGGVVHAYHFDVKAMLQRMLLLQCRLQAEQKDRIYDTVLELLKNQPNLTTLPGPDF